MLTSAHQGYIYQDILGAYFVAQEIAQGRTSTKFHFDHKKTPKRIPDKFDDLCIYQEDKITFLQVKYSNDVHRHALTKQDFASSGPYDLALFELFKTWQALHQPGFSWRIGLAWERPNPDDAIGNVLIQLPDQESLLPGTICYRFDCDILWPKGGNVHSSWSALKKQSAIIDRELFKSFLECLVIEVEYPKSTLLQDYTQGLEKILVHTIEMIGVGVYPNDHLTVRQVIESLCTIVKRERSTESKQPISCQEIAQGIGIIQSYGGVEQFFPVDKALLVATPERIEQVVEALDKHQAVVITAEPGAGKSWFIENLEKHLSDSTQIVKHYCYTALEDALSIKRITVNVLYGSLITQIVQNDEGLSGFKVKRYASNLEELNLLLQKIKKKTLLVIDGIDHIWRVYQKYRGGITEEETTILKALAKLNYSNSNISILVISQPIEQLNTLTTFYHCTLPPISEAFVEELLEKNTIPNSEVNGATLAFMIHSKSNGNALYCKYLIDYASNYKVYTSFDWVSSLPPYQYNLTGYYKYLYEQIKGDARVPCALCGADFSLTEVELKQITHLGNIVTAQLNELRPVLKFKPAFGYAIYHESFKRFVIDTINNSGASIDYLIYRPLIEWLETHTFFESTKAYGHLLKLYFEVALYDKIVNTIAENFVSDSLYHAQPFHSISQNHRIQKAVLQHANVFSSMVIIAEQSKMIYELENFSNEVLLKYLKAVKEIHGEEFMYRVFWDGDHILITKSEAFRFLVQQAYEGEAIVHWSIITFPLSIPYEMLGLVAIKLLHTKQYEKFDELVKKVYENPKHQDAIKFILDELDWWRIFTGNNWLVSTPYLQKLLTGYQPSVPILEQVLEHIISSKSFVSDEDWRVMINDLIALTKTAKQQEKEKAVKVLSNYNWFRNWLIYLIRITELSQKDYNEEDIINAFTYLIKDLDPFKGEPRTCDLYRQLPFIHKSYHQGLLLCKGDVDLLKKCCEILERVTEVTTSIQRSFNGPLIHEEYLKLIAYYLPGEYVIKKYEEFFDPLGSRRVYSNVAEIAFEYASLLSKSGKVEDAQKKYKEGIQALTAYGYRKDRSLSEILDCSAPYQQTYGTLSVEWFYELYYMAMTVVTHTDGKSTSHYPIEWFKEFIKVYPAYALKFLVSETLENTQVRWYQEEQFYHVLEDYPSLFTPTQWFLLCRSLPLASSDKMIEYGLEVFEQIDSDLNEVYGRWLQLLPKISRSDEEATHSSELASQFEKRFGISLKTNTRKRDKTEPSEYSKIQMLTDFPTTSMEDTLAFFENNCLMKHHTKPFLEMINSKSDWEEVKAILRSSARSFRHERDIEPWVDNLFEPGSRLWLYFNICLFVFVADGWFHGLHNIQYIKKAYEVNAEETLLMLKEILADFLSNNNYADLVSCNLIKALSELHVEESQVNDLLNTTFRIIKKRLPHPPNSEINKDIYEGLEEFSRDEIVVTLLIARLKTLSTEKNQGIIWSLTYIALTTPETLIKPYYWAFSNTSFLLPIHRAVLLQILEEYVDPSLISNKLVDRFIKVYPTGFFLEDQLIRSFLPYDEVFTANSTPYIFSKAHIYDDSFFPYMHLKYRTLRRHFGTLTGTFNAYEYKRDKIIKEHESYYMRSEKLLTPMVSLANAAYEIVNRQYYYQLKEISFFMDQTNVGNLNFFLLELTLQIGALSRRPSWIPTPVNFPSTKVCNSEEALIHENWILLGLNEKELSGKTFEDKEIVSSSLILSIGEKLNASELFAEYIFKVDLYTENALRHAPFDKPICSLNVVDTLERCNILFVSPFVIEKLGLIINYNLHNGFNAVNDTGEIIIKMVTWKEHYYGSISDGTEFPGLDGVAVVIRADYYSALLALYENKCVFYMNQERLSKD